MNDSAFSFDLSVIGTPGGTRRVIDGIDSCLQHASSLMKNPVERCDYLRLIYRRLCPETKRIPSRTTKFPRCQLRYATLQDLEEAILLERERLLNRLLLHGSESTTPFKQVEERFRHPRWDREKCSEVLNTAAELSSSSSSSSSSSDGKEEDPAQSSSDPASTLLPCRSEEDAVFLGAIDFGPGASWRGSATAMSSLGILQIPCDVRAERAWPCHCLEGAGERFEGTAPAPPPSSSAQNSATEWPPSAPASLKGAERGMSRSSPELYALSRAPGAYILVGCSCRCEQEYWIRRLLRDYAEPPQRRNIDLASDPDVSNVIANESGADSARVVRLPDGRFVPYTEAVKGNTASSLSVVVTPLAAVSSTASKETRAEGGGAESGTSLDIESTPATKAGKSPSPYGNVPVSSKMGGNIAAALLAQDSTSEPAGAGKTVPVLSPAAVAAASAAKLAYPVESSSASSEVHSAAADMQHSSTQIVEGKCNASVIKEHATDDGYLLASNSSSSSSSFSDTASLTFSSSFASEPRFEAQLWDKFMRNVSTTMPKTALSSTHGSGGGAEAAFAAAAKGCTLDKLSWATVGHQYDWTARQYHLPGDPDYHFHAGSRARTALIEGLSGATTSAPFNRWHAPFPEDLRQWAAAIAQMVHRAASKYFNHASGDDAPAVSEGSPVAAASAVSSLRAEVGDGVQVNTTPSATLGEASSAYDSARESGREACLRDFGLPMSLTADAGICNFYNARKKLPMGAHVDDMERDVQYPVVSLSLGCTGVFLIGGTSKEEVPIPILVRSGDVTILSGSVRLAYHGVARVFEDTCRRDLFLSEGSAAAPSEIRGEDAAFAWYARQHRLNVNVRQCS